MLALAPHPPIASQWVPPSPDGRGAIKAALNSPSPSGRGRDPTRSVGRVRGQRQPLLRDDRIDAVGVEGEAVLDAADLVIGILVAPHRILDAPSAFEGEVGG